MTIENISISSYAIKKGLDYQKIPKEIKTPNPPQGGNLSR
jgi:hypothetical protein